MTLQYLLCQYLNTEVVVSSQQEVCVLFWCKQEERKTVEPTYIFNSHHFIGVGTSAGNIVFFQHCLTAAEGKQVAKRSHKLQLVDLLRASYNISHIWEFTWTIPSGHFSLGTMTSPEMMKKTHCISFTKIDWSTNPVKLVSEVGSNPPRIHAGILKYEIVNLITTKSY